MADGGPSGAPSRSPGDEPPASTDDWIRLLYDALRSLAEREGRREGRDHTLPPTALVHEAYLRLGAGAPAVWSSREEFLGIAARVVRRVLVDHARRRAADRRGGGLVRVPLVEEAAPSTSSDVDVLVIDEALGRLAERHARAAQVIEMRFFCGMSMEEIAGALGVSVRSVTKDWAFGRAWLGRFLGEAG